MVKWVVVFLSIGALTALAWTGLERVAQSGGSEASGESLFAVNASFPDLLREADVILIGRLSAERTEKVTIPSAVAGATGGTREDLVRTFDVVERIRAGGTTGASIDVRESKGIELSRMKLTDLPDRIEFEPYRLSKGELYVLFLRRFDLEAGHDAWGPALSPSIAALRADRLEFLTTADYRAAAAEGGRPIIPRSFDVDVATVRALEPAMPRRVRGDSSTTVAPLAAAMDSALPLLLSARADTDASSLGVDADALRTIRERGVACRKMEEQAKGITGFSVALGCVSN